MVITTRFELGAPVDAAWAYLLDVQKIAHCVPGASLTDVVDDKTYAGKVEVKLGPIGLSYKGRIVIGAAAWKIRQGLLPFESAIHAGVKLVMLSTAIYPKLDATDEPAAFSSAIANGLLRKTLGFEGVTVTDSLTAPAADTIPHTATRAMLAGSDLLIFGAESASERGYSTLLADAAGSPRLRARLTQAAARIRALKAWLAAHGGAICSSA